MQLEQFFNHIENHPGLTCCGFVEGEQTTGDYVIIQDRKNSGKYSVTVETILAEEWDCLEKILTGRREPLVLEHITRIVGYFSKVKNWNKSKLGELRDRQAGNYKVEETRPPAEKQTAPVCEESQAINQEEANLVTAGPASQ